VSEVAIAISTQLTRRPVQTLNTHKQQEQDSSHQQMLAEQSENEMHMRVCDANGRAGAKRMARVFISENAVYVCMRVCVPTCSLPRLGPTYSSSGRLCTCSAP
jgi:hypothetical protein